MGYFAVLKDASEHVEIRRCHINVWLLNGWFGRRIVFDVGLALVADQPKESKPACKSLRLALPFTVFDDELAFEDLRPQMIDPRTATLVFGEPVTVPSPGRIRFGNTTLKPIRSDGKRNADRSDTENAVSVWNISWEADPSPDVIYLRMRFHVRDSKRLWSATSEGALLDLRVCDSRETINPKWESLESQILPIKALNVLAIVPAHLKERAVSPPAKHVRLLEGESWEDYLKRKIVRWKLWGQQKFCVYHWATKDKTVDETEPFRAFLDLEKFPRGFGYGTTLAIMLVVCLATIGGPSLREWIGAEWLVVKGSLGAMSLTTIYTTLRWVYGQRDAAAKIPASLRSLERSWYGQ